MAGGLLGLEGFDLGRLGADFFQNNFEVQFQQVVLLAERLQLVGSRCGDQPS